MNEGFDHWQGDGDWRSQPWFLRPNTLFDEWGYPFELRKRAADALARLYTPAICRRIREADPAVAFGAAICLFTSSWPGMVTPLLNRAEYSATAFEIRIWANLKRGDYPVRRIAETQEATPDLQVDVGPDAYDVEIKLPS